MKNDPDECSGRRGRILFGPVFVYEICASGIIWSMEYLDAYLIEEKEKKRAFLPDIGRPKRILDVDGEVETAFLLFPSGLLKRPEMLEKKIFRAARRWPPRGQIWYEDRLLAACKEKSEAEQKDGLPRIFWMKRFLLEQPFRENMIVLLPESGEEEADRMLAGQERWMQEFLGAGYAKLNGLLLISAAIPESAGSFPLMENHAYYRYIYQDTGLPVIGAGKLPEYFRGKEAGRTVCVDARSGGEVPFRSLPGKTLYLDMTSDPEKERLLYAKRRDVCYRSVRMYLDTFVRKRYNTNRCKLEEKGRRQLPSGAFTMKEQERE